VSLKRSCVGFSPNMSMMKSSEKPQTKASHPAAPVRTLDEAAGEGALGNGLHRPSVDEVEGAEA
jgi:hypothetical protein